MKNDLESITLYNELYCFYQELFTEKQRVIFESYFVNNFSLSEIANDIHISRNAVWDSLNKAIEKLTEYEKKLHLCANNKKLQEKLNNLEKYTNDIGKKIIQEIREME